MPYSQNFRKGKIGSNILNKAWLKCLSNFDILKKQCFCEKSTDVVLFITSFYNNRMLRSPGCCN